MIAPTTQTTAAPLSRFREERLVCALFACTLILLAGCASEPPGFGSGPPPTQVSITTQPTNQDVPMGRPATFTVSANGTAPTQYQWSKNGAAIAGATVLPTPRRT